MATTYNKTLKTVQIKVHGIETPYSVADTATSAVASSVLASYEAYKGLVFPGDDETVYVPFHAIEAIMVEETTTEVTKADATCVSE